MIRALLMAPTVRVVEEGEGHAGMVILNVEQGDTAVLVGLAPCRARAIAAELVRRAEAQERSTGAR
ncbi:hypothetical protein [Polyangium sorediatum]|uniref:Uncharacterized protein n=1 Tax=Polyangium sorediatum TaxID=889274 RepID=A0ABT6NL58_9BACT|nr:hypothetical protein [Polyangium sorediatum]MDI1429051.1 hypothetical protein [Polyangium sorediatum]